MLTKIWTQAFKIYSWIAEKNKCWVPEAGDTQRQVKGLQLMPAPPWKAGGGGHRQPVQVEFGAEVKTPHPPGALDLLSLDTPSENPKINHQPGTWWCRLLCESENQQNPFCQPRKQKESVQFARSTGGCRRGRCLLKLKTQKNVTHVRDLQIHTDDPCTFDS